MKNTGSILIASALLLTIFTVTSAINTSAQAYQCKSQKKTAIGSAGTRAYALINSQNIWSSYIKRQYGMGWSFWNIAAKRSTKCKRLRPSHRTSKWSCTRSARPCLLAVR